MQPFMCTVKHEGHIASEPPEVIIYFLTCTMCAIIEKTYKKSFFLMSILSAPAVTSDGVPIIGWALMPA